MLFPINTIQLQRSRILLPAKISLCRLLYSRALGQGTELTRVDQHPTTDIDDQHGDMFIKTALERKKKNSVTNYPGVSIYCNQKQNHNNSSHPLPLPPLQHHTLKHLDPLTPTYRLFENAPKIESQINTAVSPKLGLFSISRSLTLLSEWRLWCE